MSRHAHRIEPADTGQPPETWSDARLVAGARDGDEASVRELVRRCNPRMFRVARGILDSDAAAEDVVQDAYVAAFTRLDQFRGDAAFATWLTRIVINAAHMHLRRDRRQESHDSVNETFDRHPDVLAFPGARSEDAAAALERGQMRGILERAVAGLPAELRLPFLMHEVEGMSVRTIAADLSLNPVTVRTRMFRARRRLRRSIEMQVHGGFAEIFPFDGARCAAMADRVVEALRRAGQM